MIPSRLTALLEQHGLTEKEALTYLALLEIGKSNATRIASQSKLNRATTYVVLEQLRQKNFVLEESGGTKHFVAVSPKEIAQRALRQARQLHDAVPELSGLRLDRRERPSVHFFQGSDGVRHVYEQTLSLPKGSEILAFGNAQAVEKAIDDFGGWYIERRKASGISMRAIVTESPYSEIIRARDSDELRETRVLPLPVFTQDVEVNIYDGHVALISHASPDPYAILLASEVFAEGYAQLFNALWTCAPAVAPQKKSTSNPATR